MDLLYRSFQAKLARGDFNLATAAKKSVQPNSTEKPSTQTKPSQIKLPMFKMAPKTMTPPLPQQHQLVPHQQQAQHQQHQQMLLTSSASMSTLTQPTPVITSSPYASTELVMSNSCGTTASAAAAAVQNYNAQVAYLQQQNFLALGQHPFYASATFPTTAPSSASMFSFPAQFVWPTTAAHLGMAPTAQNSAATYATAGYPTLSSGGSLIGPDNFALFHNNPYLATASVGLKRPHSGDYETDASKRLRLATIPF